MKADRESQVASRVREAMDAEPRIRAAGAPIAIDVAAAGSLACDGFLLVAKEGIRGQSGLDGKCA